MTLLQLLIAALDELERPHDEATLALWRERLTAYANEAIADLYATFRPWRRESLTPQNGVLTLTALTMPCSKVLGLERDGVRIPFYYGTDTNELVIPGWGNDPLIVLYMVARDRAHGDPAAQNGSRLRLSVYEAQKRRLKLDYDEPSGCRICNYR